MPWGLVWRALLVSAGLLGLVLAANAVLRWRDEARAVPRLEELLREERRSYEAQLSAQRRAFDAAQSALESYATELETLRNRRVPPRVVRLCPSPESPETPRPAPDTPSSPGILPGDSRPDIGPGLYALADRCDEIAAQLRALQEWTRAAPEL